MESHGSRWSAPSLMRHKTAIIALTALALGCSLYYVHHQTLSPETQRPKAPGLRRSNARRQRRRATSGSPPRILVVNQVFDPIGKYVEDQPWGSTPIDLGFLRSTAVSDQKLADHILVSAGGRTVHVTLRRHLPSVADIRGFAASPEEAVSLRRELEATFLSYYFFRHLSPSPVNEEQREVILHELNVDGDFSPEVIQAVLWDHQNQQLRETIVGYTQTQYSRVEAQTEGTPLPTLDPPVNQTTSDLQYLGDVSAATSDESEHSWREERETEDGNAVSKEGQSLLNLLYRIAEEQARKEGYVHRRVTCNACNTMPIRGIRYHCANCLDYDLCEQCEAMQVHPKTHIFYKIRIPAPFIRNPRQPEPIWYPGKPAVVNLSLARDATANICKQTGFQIAEVEALWEQFRCLAGTEWPDDPGGYRLAIDRQTFDKCFVPQTSLRPPPPNLIYDRMFAFYDQNSDGLIGFKEFIDGLASLTRQKADERPKKLFQGYDINNDGFVDRKDFLRMFRAYYAVTKELTRDVIVGMEDDVSESGARDIILGSQPISSAFTGVIPPGERSRGGEGKSRDNYGDLMVFDDMTVVDEKEDHVADQYHSVTDSTTTERSRLQREKLEIISRVCIDPWPPDAITIEDVGKVLDQAIDPKLVSALEDQEKIRRCTHAMLAESYQKEQQNLRMLLCEEQGKRAFYLDGSDGAVPAKTSLMDIPQLDSTHSKNLERLMAAGKGDDFYHHLKHKIKDTGWPVVGSWTSLAEAIVELILSDCTGLTIAEDLLGYAFDFTESALFVMSVLVTLESLVGQLDPQKTDQESNPKSLPSRRSRSSSKVRFQDDIGTDECQDSRSRATSISSRSIPINERWGGVEIPEPERDVGREVLFQATQEALNELLDPIFKLREDLALAALRTQRKRERFRAQAAAEVKDPMQLVKALRLYQQRWRRDPNFDVSAIEWGDTMDDEAGALSQFIKHWTEGEPLASVAEKCWRCLKRGEHHWIRLGAYCTTCGQDSSYSSNYLQNGKATPEEPCSRCFREGRESLIGGSGSDRSFSCAKCGQESEFYKAENARLLRIISGGQPPVTPATTVSDENIVGVPQSSPESKPDPLPSGSALDLEGSVTAFNNIDPSSVEQTIAQKPLDDLLLDSGYSIATTPGTASPLPDPTLPQNRPTNTPPPTSSHPDNDAPETNPQPDPTLPQNRSNDPPIHEPSTSRPPSPEPFPDLNIAPDKDMLRYYAALSLLEHEDKERAGPGRLNFEEFEEVMKGEKGKGLGFLGTWMELASF